VRFSSEEIGLEAFGYNINNRTLSSALEARAAELSGLTRFDDEAQTVSPDEAEIVIRMAGGTSLTARLVVGADGRHSLCRDAAGIAVKRRDLKQSALTFNISHSRPHKNISTEFHTTQGPCVFVPLPGNRCSVVWVASPKEAERLMALSDDELSDAAEKQSHSILGGIRIEPGRHLFPLAIEQPAKIARHRVALIGEAAHVVPPIGAQGLNMGLRDAADIADIVRMAEAASLARDLINTPSNDMGPEELAAAAEGLAKRFGASFKCIVGDDLVAQNFPLIHAVGMASTRAPRLIDIGWGDPSHPKVTLVGKGVCFDTGGLDLKPSSGMLIMKKDMGGAANVLALAQMVMDAKLKIRLRVLIPAVENAVAGNAFRPLDIFKSRKGPTVEIGNTDAEGRLVLADALALADEEKPDLLVDLGTLTGAARVALGPDLPPFYTNDETLAGDVAVHAKQENDPLWRLPLWPAYDSWLDSKVADINNAPSGGFAGSITCALFLQRFVSDTTRWLHVDIYGWTPSAKPARPEGGECQAARAIYRLLSQRYG